MIRTMSLGLCLAMSATPVVAEPPSAADVLGGGYLEKVDTKKPAVPAKKPAAATPALAPAAATKPLPKVVPAPAAAANKVPPVVVPQGQPAAQAPAKPVAAAPAQAPQPGTAADTRPAKKIFGAAKAPAALAARAIGGYAKGCLAGGAPLAIDGPNWQAMRLSRNRNWGHPKLIALLERFAKEMREKENWPGLLIGDLAQPRGGPMLSGHKSHQIGLDADIWFRPMPGQRMTTAERETAQPLLLANDNGAEVIPGNWNEGFVRLVRRAAKYPEVERIFVHPAIKKAFCNAAGDDRDWLRKVRPMWLHNYHFHVRMGCTGDSPTCVPQKAIETEGDGCGKEVEDWIKLVSRPAKAAAPKPPVEPVKPVKPAKPPPQMMLKDLPPECTEVATAASKPVPAKATAAAAPPAETGSTQQ